jgi:hypothetical protein
VVSVASRPRAGASGFGGVVPAAVAASADGGRTGERGTDGSESIARGAAALVRNALVVSAWGHCDDAALDDAGRAGAAGHDATTTAGHARLDASPAGHVFCLSALLTKHPIPQHACEETGRHVNDH